MELRITTVTEEAFEKAREIGRLTPGAYRVTPTTASHYYSPIDQFAFSPDGQGCFWYESAADMIEAHA